MRVTKVQHDKPATQTTDDPDETEGRKLYRTRADSLAHTRLSMAKRRVSRRSCDCPAKPGEDCPLTAAECETRAAGYRE